MEGVLLDLSPIIARICNWLARSVTHIGLVFDVVADVEVSAGESIGLSLVKADSLASAWHYILTI